VLAGIAAGGAVLSTLRQAADLGYGPTVLTDGGVDDDPEMLGDKVPQPAAVATIGDWTEPG
jgi:nicotinamidase-related amidase